MLNNDSFQSVKEKNFIQNFRHPVPNDFLNSFQSENILPDSNIYNLFQVTDTSVIFDNMVFNFDSYTPSKTLTLKVDSIFIANKFNIDSIKIIGHADKIGTDEYNDELSFNRANSIADYIQSKKYIDRNKIIIIGAGNKYPIDTSGNDNALYKNRRVEIIKYFSLNNS